MSDGPLFTVREFSRLNRLSEDALRKAIRFGRLVSVKSGRNRYINQDSYAAYRAECKAQAFARKGLILGC